MAQAIIGWIKGVNTAGAKIPVPTIFGADYQVRRCPSCACTAAHAEESVS